MSITAFDRKVLIGLTNSPGTMTLEKINGMVKLTAVYDVEFYILTTWEKLWSSVIKTAPLSGTGNLRSITKVEPNNLKLNFYFVGGQMFQISLFDFVESMLIIRFGVEKMRLVRLVLTDLGLL